MKFPSFGLPLLCAVLMPVPGAFAGQAEADFNDLKLGDTRTRGSSSSQNDGILNTGSGFAVADATATGGWGEYNNNTGVLQFEKGDLQVPSGITNFISDQRTPIDPLTSGLGVVFGSSVETGLASNKYRRFQERRLNPTMTGGTVWFSFLFRLDGPLAEGRVLFNKPSTENSSDAAAAAFAVSMGNQTQPGAIAIDTAATQSPAIITDPASIYFDSGITDLNNNGKVDGVDVGLGSISNIKTHLIIGRVVNNASGDDLIEVWLDPADALDLGTPTLTATDEIGANGITSIAFEGTRFIAPVSDGGSYTDGGHFALDHFRMSDQENATDFITGNILVDPKLVIDPGSPAFSFNFKGIYGSGLPATSLPITVRLKNTGANESITIHSTNFATATSAFTITSPPISELVLGPQQTVDITMVASSSVFETANANSLVIDTDVDAQDMSIGVNATFFTNGSRVNPNPGFEVNLDGWISDDYLAKTPALQVSPGFLGSTGMARLRGIGDPAGGNPDNLSQVFLNGASDWEFNFVFSPIDATAFESYAGTIAGPVDRTFQVILQADGNAPQPASGTEGSFTEAHNGVAALINLAYLPAGGGFCVYNGSNWESLNLPLIAGSIDGTKNGILNSQNPAEADTVNAYLVRIKGTGFGTSSAKYSVSVSQPNSVVTASVAEDLAIFAAASGQTSTPASYTFTTGDISNSGRYSEMLSFATSFWIDEVSFSSVAARDPAVTFGGPVTVLSHNGVTLSGVASITNTGFTENMNVTGLSFEKDTIFSTSTVFPVTVPPGTTAKIPININSANFTAPDNAAITNMRISTDVTAQQTVSVVGAGTTDANMFGNWNFEIPGTDATGDNDSFAFWDEYVAATASKNVPGLITGSATAVYLSPACAIRNNFNATASDFIIDTYFAVKDTTDRALNFTVIGDNGGILNLRYEANKWETYQTSWNTIIDMTASPLATSNDANGNLSLNDNEDTKNVYQLRITGTGWKSASPTYKIEILDLTGTTVAASASGFAYYQFNPPAGGAKTFTLNTNNTTNAGFWADDIKSYLVVSSDVVITSFSGGPEGFTLNWDSGGAPVTVERSTTLEEGSWIEISVADADGTHFDPEPPLGRAFYRVRK